MERGGLQRAMRKIGLIGGVSPQSTVFYYRLLNDAARVALGKDHSAEIVIHALDFGVMMEHYTASNWPVFKSEVVKAGQGLEAAGCDALAISSNTTQMAADVLAGSVSVPVINLLEVLGVAMIRKRVSKPLLLGTPFVMEGDFYRPQLKARFGIEAIIPDAGDRKTVDRVIFEELVEGEVLEGSRNAYLEIIAKGVQSGADSVILGCTEIGLLIEQRHTEMPVFDTTRLHAAAIADFALGREKN